MKLDLKKLVVLGSILLGAMSLNSCLNNDDELPVPQEMTFVAFLNASPDSNGLKFYRNSNIINSNSTNYGQLFGYVNLEPGQQVLTVRSTANDLDSLNINLGINKRYSIFAVDKLDNLHLVAYEDTFTQPSSSSKTLIRFIQLSPDAPLVRLKIEGSQEDLGEFSFKQSSGNKEINEAFNKEIYLVDAETNDTIFTKTVQLMRGKVYSLFSKGFVNTTNVNQKLDVQIIPVN